MAKVNEAPKVAVNRIHISELELLTIGTVNDMYTEMNNDENREAYSTLASQEDMDAF